MDATLRAAAPLQLSRRRRLQLQQDQSQMTPIIDDVSASKKGSTSSSRAGTRRCVAPELPSIVPAELCPCFHPPDDDGMIPCTLATAPSSSSLPPPSPV